MSKSVFESIRHLNHLYVFYNGDLIFKRWLRPDGSKSEPSLIYNDVFPNEKIIRHEPPIDEPEETNDAGNVEEKILQSRIKRS